MTLGAARILVCGFSVMNRTHFVSALLLLISIISPSCDSKPKEAPTEKAKAKEVSANQTISEEAPTKEIPGEKAPTEETPSEEAPAEETPMEEAPAEETSTEQSPVDEMKQSKLEYLELLQNLLAKAVEKDDQEEVSKLTQEIEQIVSDLNEINNYSKANKEALEKAENIEISENKENNVEVIEQQIEVKEEKTEPVESPESTQNPVQTSPFEKDIARLVKLLDSEKARAVTPIQKRFDLAAQQLLRKVTQAGNLDAAIKLKSVIEKPEELENFSQDALAPHEKEFLKLVAQREKDAAIAVAPAQKRFDLAAQQILRKATQAGDLDAAIKLKAIIEQARGSAEPAPVKPAKEHQFSDNSESPSSSSKSKENSEKDFEYRFQGESVEISKYVGKSSRVRIPAMIQGVPVTSMGWGAFAGCNEVREVVLPDTMKSLSSNIFSCQKLKQLKIPASVHTIGNSLTKFCTELDAIEVDPANQYYTSVDGVLYDKNVSVLINFPAGIKMQILKVPYTVKQVAGEAFRGAKLKTLQVPKDAQIHEKAFQDASIRVVRY